MPGDHQTGVDRKRSDHGRQQHDSWDRRRPGQCRRRRGDQQAEDQQGADHVEGRHHRDGQQHGERRDREVRAQAEGGGLAWVERHGDERAVADHHGGQGEGQGDGQHHHVAGAYREDVAEEEAGEVDGEALRPGHDDDAECEHPDQQQSDAGVRRQLRRAADGGDTHGHHQCGHQSTGHQADAEQRRGGDTGQHAVRHRLAEKDAAAQHDPAPDQRAQAGGDHPGHQCPHDDVRLERRDEPVGHVVHS